MSLFPFLAVLLCTMGALLVLLVLFGYSAGQQDQQAAAEQAQQQAAELRLAAENLRWRLDQLAAMREQTGADLESLRLQLAGIEEHSRTLSAELKELQQIDARLEADVDADGPDAAELAALEEALASARESLDEARRERDSRPPAYAVVPYEGKSGTHRRPLFIECSLDGVFLQPEGIRLNPDDFEGPPGPGNPLASALRAAREYLARQAVSQDDPALRPYPLLLVRPSGVMAYYAAREALGSWGTDFGYQLIDEDWTIAFPKKDLALQDIEMQAINEARERLAWLAQTGSAVRRRRPTGKQYRASSVRGGIVADSGPTVLGDQSRWDWANQQAAQGQPGGGGTGNGLGRGDGIGSGQGNGGLTGITAGVAPAGRPVAAGTATGGLGRGGVAAGIGQGGPSAVSTGSLTGSGSAAGEIPGGAGGEATFGSGTGQPGGLPGGGPAGGLPEGLAVTGGMPGGSQQTNGGNAQTAAGGGDDGDSGGATAGAGGGSGNDGLAAAGGAGSGGSAGAGQGDSAAGSPAAGGGAGGGMTGGPQLPLNMSMGGQQAGGSSQASGSQGAGGGGSLAGVRGSDWASFATSQRYIPLTRPIQLECAADELRLLDDAGRRVVVRIPVFAQTVDSVDALVAAVRRRVDSWGIAGDRLYWKPELILSETPDGGGRRADLQQLLAGSGLNTRLKQRTDEVERLPVVKQRRRTAQRELSAATEEARR